MLWDASAIKGYEVEASDGTIGKASDLLFDDESWEVRWLVVDVGSWLTGRTVLLPLAVLGRPDPALRRFPVSLSLAQIKDSPDADTHPPVSRQFEANMDRATLDRGDTRALNTIGANLQVSNAMALPFVQPVFWPAIGLYDPEPGDPERRPLGDPHLRSVAAVTGYHLHATDGELGHVENFLVEDGDWGIRYLVVNTGNWWPGETVLISPRSVHEIDWTGRAIHVSLDRQKIKAAPRYQPGITLDSAYDEKFLSYYGIKWTKK